MSFVGVRSCYSLPEAMVVRSVLAARGVSVALTNENLAFQSWNWLVAFDGIEVKVLEAERDLALALLTPVATEARNAESEAFRRRRFGTASAL